MTSDSPVLLLTVDTLRADRFNQECFPETYATFTDDFAHFSSALSHGNATPLAFPSIITSHPVVGDGSFVAAAKTLAELFDDRECIGFSNNAHLRGERGYDRGFDQFHDLVPPDARSPIDRLKQNDLLRESDIVTKTYRVLKNVAGIANTRNTGSITDPFPNPKTTAETVTDFVQRQLSKHSNPFVWAHYMDPHKPFHPDQAVDGPEITRSREEIKHLNSYEHSDDPLPDEEMSLMRALYESNIRYLDRELSRLFTWLQTNDQYDDSLIIVLGDHGELFGEHQRMFHPWDVDPFDELIRTPLLVKYPSGDHGGLEFDHLVQHADIMPTVAEVSDLSTEFISELAHPLTDTIPRQVISKSNVSIRITEPNGVGIKRRDGSTEGLEDLSTTARGILREQQFPEVRTSGGVAKGVEDQERQKQLKALGYQ
ncbi:sulfatase-like hydrolase/transferase [Halogeometricum luteum]|uniref:Sulfatase-like hydrolase/transferase n=1 Tax=Halogeometricum luteum TaxID=2950537 RepID=A0ABU2FX41_9EURY|nr:sulfatase-like hydrolase/transferase [Halogeometricum sp. S3BR5-2]MDS0292776.1 sulfatase-like hydrolase/transferase [Halogeometricum sp. S3BR5-2]